MQTQAQTQPVANDAPCHPFKKVRSQRVVVRFETHDGEKRFDGYNEEEALELAEEALGVSLAYDVEKFGRLFRVEQLRLAKANTWFDRPRVSFATTVEPGAWAALLDTIHAFPNIPVGPCPFDDEGNRIH